MTKGTKQTKRAKWLVLEEKAEIAKKLEELKFKISSTKFKLQALKQMPARLVKDYEEQKGTSYWGFFSGSKLTGARQEHIQLIKAVSDSIDFPEEDSDVTLKQLQRMDENLISQYKEKYHLMFAAYKIVQMAIEDEYSWLSPQGGLLNKGSYLYKALTEGIEAMKVRAPETLGCQQSFYTLKNFVEIDGLHLAHKDQYLALIDQMQQMQQMEDYRRPIVA